MFKQNVKTASSVEKQNKKTTEFSLVTYASIFECNTQISKFNHQLTQQQVPTLHFFSFFGLISYSNVCHNAKVKI